MTRTSRKRKLDTIVLSGSEGEQSTCSHSQVTPAWTYDSLLTLGCRELTLPIAAYSQQHDSHCSYRNLRAKQPDLESLPLQVFQSSLLVPGVKQLTLVFRQLYQQIVMALTVPCYFAESRLLQTCTPKSSADLAVQKKKVGEVKDWLLADHGPGLLLLSGGVLQLSAASLLRSPRFVPWHPHCFWVLAGPPGCGKTITVKTLASELGIEVTEWTTPTPVLWAEHLQQVIC